MTIYISPGSFDRIFNILKEKNIRVDQYYRLPKSGPVTAPLLERVFNRYYEERSKSAQSKLFLVESFPTAETPGKSLIFINTEFKTGLDEREERSRRVKRMMDDSSQFGEYIEYSTDAELVAKLDPNLKGEETSKFDEKTTTEEMSNSDEEEDNE